MPGGQSRWSQGKDLSWEPLRPELVVEVAYEHMQGARFRHTAQFRRWRTDKKPGDCTYAQLEVVAAARADGDFCRRPLKPRKTCSRILARCMARSTLGTPLTRRIVIRVGRFLRGSQRFGHMAEVYPDAGPCG